MKPISCGSKAGFTLVELIVVIAILAILAGVAIPVYSGYIEKANQAADETLLAAVNTAYGAACLENNCDTRKIIGSATLTNGMVTGVGPTQAINNSFMRYFDSNANTPFRVYKGLAYNVGSGVFVGKETEGSAVLVSYKGGTLELRNDDVAALQSSNLLSEDGTIDSLIAEVNGVQALASVFDATHGGGSFTRTVESAEFQAFFEEITGTSYNDYTASMTQEQKEKLNYNAFVLFAAQGAASMNDEQYLSNFEDPTSYQDNVWNDYSETLKKVGRGESVTAEEIVKAAITYGQTIGLANFSARIDQFTEETYDLDNEEYYAWWAEHYPGFDPDNDLPSDYYFTSGNARADALGYISAMNMMTENLSDPEMVQKLLNDGFDDDLINALNAALGAANP